MAGVGEHAPPRRARGRCRRGARMSCCDDDRLEHQRQLRADLRLLVRRKDVDDAAEGLHGGAGVQGREDQMAGLGDGERRLDGLPVAHLADQHDVGVLAQHVLQRGAEPLACRSRPRAG